MQALAHVRKNFIVFLRDFFSSGKIVGGANEGNVYHWDPDITKTEIIIQGANIENPEVLNKVPALLIQRSDLQEYEEYKSLGKSASSYDWEEGKMTHVDIMGCAVTVSCLSSNDEEAENLAQIVYFLLKMHRSYFSKEFKYRKIVLAGIGSPRIIQYEGENTEIRIWNCGVVMKLSFHVGYRYKSNGDNIDRIYVPFVHDQEGVGDQADGTRPPAVVWAEEVN